MVYELTAQYDARASFYGKAQVEIGGASGEDKILYSYNTPICKRELGKGITLLNGWDCSATSLRHLKEFLLQEGYKVSSKKDIINQFVK